MPFFSCARNIHYEAECVFIPSHQGPPRVCLLSSLQSEMVKYQKWWRSYKASEIPVFLIPFLSELRSFLGWFPHDLRYYFPVWELWASPRSVRGRLCVSMGYQGRTASLLAPVAASSLHVETILFLFLTAHSISTWIVPDCQTVVCVSLVCKSHSWV